jgi:hypothetical protein
MRDRTESGNLHPAILDLVNAVDGRRHPDLPRSGSLWNVTRAK